MNPDIKIEIKDIKGDPDLGYPGILRGMEIT